MAEDPKPNSAEKIPEQTPKPEVRKSLTDFELEPHYLASSRIMLKNHLDRFAENSSVSVSDDSGKLPKIDSSKTYASLRTGFSSEDPLSKYYSSTLDSVS